MGITGGHRRRSGRRGAPRSGSDAPHPHPAPSAASATPSQRHDGAHLSSRDGNPGSAEEGSESCDAEPPDAVEKPVLPQVDIFECAVSILLFLPGHDRRSLSRGLKDALDRVAPIYTLGPPPLPATLFYREPIGNARAGYGLTVPCYKTVTVKTCERTTGSKKTIFRWDSTSSKSFLGYGHRSTHAADGTMDAAASCKFWKAALRLLRAAELGNFTGMPDKIMQGRLVRIRFGNTEHSFQGLTPDLLHCLEGVEACMDQFH